MTKIRLLDPTDPRRHLDRYELIGALASGGMATVFLGRLAGVAGFQRFVAVKRLHPHLAGEPELLEMFLDEARLAAGIHHQHVVPIVEIGQSEGSYYLVMEYIEGDTLARLLARSQAMARPVPRPVLLRVVLDALAGLHAAHELEDADGQPVRLVHGDVSPQNILVGVDGCARITDFGVAHIASRSTGARADRLKGKLAYMSPEQARLDEVDRRADVFAMGIILWEVLAARRLFQAERQAITLQLVTVEPIPRLATAAPGTHHALDHVCARALERDPDLRYRSTAEMAEALERAAHAAASPGDTGVASAREVAVYMQGALGEDLAERRASVRAWLAVGRESASAIAGLPARRELGFEPFASDVTVKVPLDRSSHGDDEEQDTLPRMPSAPAPPLSSASRRGPSSEQAALERLAASAPPPSRMPQVVAVMVGLVIAVASLVLWSQMRAGHALPQRTPTPGTAVSLVDRLEGRADPPRS